MQLVCDEFHATPAPTDFVIPCGPMLRTARLTTLSAFIIMSLAACEKSEPAPKPEPAKSAPPPAPTPTTPPVASAVASAAPEPHHDCPEGSEGVGSFAKPCEAKGAARMMEVTWNGKMSDTGAPTFRVVNKSKLVILYGKIVTYFYDKAGKQLEVTAGGKPRPMQICSGRIFAGAIKPEEKIFVFFSCVKKAYVPEGTVTIEAEAKGVGFANEAGTDNEFYWSNMDLVPDARPKGGIKAKPKKK